MKQLAHVLAVREITYEQKTRADVWPGERQVITAALISHNTRTQTHTRVSNFSSVFYRFLLLFLICVSIQSLVTLAHTRYGISNVNEKIAANDM